MNGVEHIRDYLRQRLAGNLSEFEAIASTAARFGLSEHRVALHLDALMRDQSRPASSVTLPAAAPAPTLSAPAPFPLASATRDPQALYTRVVDGLRALGCFDGRGTKATKVKAIARCPLHADSRPSLAMTWNERGVALFCHSCKHRGTALIVERLGLKLSDLQAHRWVGRQEVLPPREIARYAYVDLHGVVIAEKVRFEGKRFRWVRHDAHGREHWDLRNLNVGLYRLPDLIDCPVVCVVEGEKAVEQLWERGWPATCAPHGAGRWWPELSEALWRTGCRSLHVLPDHDANGAAHAELVAETTMALPVEPPMVVRVVQPHAGHPTKLNLVDWWIDGNRSEAEVLDIIDATPTWAPGWAERARRERQRELTRARVKEWRKRQRPDIRSVTGSDDDAC